MPRRPYLYLLYSQEAKPLYIHLYGGDVEEIEILHILEILVNKYFQNSPWLTDGVKRIWKGLPTFHSI
jgi:hypothetical protein